MYDELKDKGLEIVAVNRGDTAEQIQKYVREEKFSFPIVMAGSGEQYTLGKAYGVNVYPTNFLVDESGKIVWRGLGFNETVLRNALAKLGVK
jgi:hypothetical protein